MRCAHTPMETRVHFAREPNLYQWITDFKTVVSNVRDSMNGDKLRVLPKNGRKLSVLLSVEARCIIKPSSPLFSSLLCSSSFITHFFPLDTKNLPSSPLLTRFERPDRLSRPLRSLENGDRAAGSSPQLQNLLRHHHNCSDGGAHT